MQRTLKIFLKDFYMEIKELRELFGYLVEVDGAWGWYYQYLISIIDDEPEFITISLN